jgi:hypothetical protein
MSEAPWKESEAKALLKRDILNGKITQSTNLDKLWQSSVLYKRFPLQNFKTNVKSLLKSVEKYQERAIRDDQALEHDMHIHPPVATKTSGEPLLWDGSLAQTQLKSDVANGFHQDMTPKELWMSRRSYQLFTLPKFRQHMYKEKTSLFEKSYWLNKKTKK